MQTLAIALLLSSMVATPAPADIRLEWIGGAAPIEGSPGRTVELHYAVRNVGGSEAFAVVVRGLSSLGPTGDPIRLQPGPAPGKKIERRSVIALATGMRELCIEATLQNRNRDDPLDPTPSDNRICRIVKVKAEGK